MDAKQKIIKLDNDRLFKEWFEEIYETHFERLYRYAFSIIKDKQLAENVVSELFLTIWQKKPDYHKIGDLNSYLHVSVKHSAIRVASKDVQRFCYSAYDETLQISDTIDPESLLLAKELDQFIEDSINRMPAQCKVVYEMSKIQGLTAQEVALELGISKRTVEGHLYNVIKSLKEKLEYHFDKHPRHLRLLSRINSLLLLF